MNGRKECRGCLQDDVMTKVKCTGTIEVWRCASCKAICVIDPAGNGNWYSYQGSVVRAPSEPLKTQEARK